MAQIRSNPPYSILTYKMCVTHTPAVPAGKPSGYTIASGCCNVQSDINTVHFARFAFLRGSPAAIGLRSIADPIAGGADLAGVYSTQCVAPSLVYNATGQLRAELWCCAGLLIC